MESIQKRDVIRVSEPYNILGNNAQATVLSKDPVTKCVRTDVKDLTSAPAFHGKDAFEIATRNPYV